MDYGISMLAFVVEPSRFILNYLSAALNEAGIVVRDFDSGREAVAALRAGPAPCLVCTSLVTRDWQGEEVLRAVAEEPALGGTAVVLITSAEGDAPEAGAGFRAVFRKNDLKGFAAWAMRFAAAAAQESVFRGRILYVEDSPTAVELFGKILDGRPVELRSCSSADAALELLAAENWDLVVADYTLAGSRTGLDLVRAIRRNRRDRLPILVLSGLVNPDRVADILESGANDFVAKPVNPRELLARMATLLENKRLIEELETQKLLFYELAMRDQLTTLFNRRSLFDLAPKLLADSLRHGRPLSLLVADIDHFKLVNDRRGHQAGDQVLRAVGGLFRARSREGDLAARFGGEEFVVVLTDCGLAGALARAEDLRAAVAALEPDGIPVTASFGVAVSGPARNDLEELFRAADAALYRAKAAGRNRVEAADERADGQPPAEWRGP
jgi:two-component system cell cycle response regulator